MFLAFRAKVTHLPTYDRKVFSWWMVEGGWRIDQWILGKLENLAILHSCILAQGVSLRRKEISNYYIY